jgi:hypothetical protein
VEHRSLELLFLPVHLERTHALARQVRGVERLGGCVAIDEDCIIADCAGQDMGDRIEDRERVFPEEEGRARID